MSRGLPFTSREAFTVAQPAPNSVIHGYKLPTRSISTALTPSEAFELLHAEEQKIVSGTSALQWFSPLTANSPGDTILMNVPSNSAVSYSIPPDGYEYADGEDRSEDAVGSNLVVVTATAGSKDGHVFRERFFFSPDCLLTLIAENAERIIQHLQLVHYYGDEQGVEIAKAKEIERSLATTAVLPLRTTVTRPGSQSLPQGTLQVASAAKVSPAATPARPQGRPPSVKVPGSASGKSGPGVEKRGRPLGSTKVAKLAAQALQQAEMQQQQQIQQLQVQSLAALHAQKLNSLGNSPTQKQFKKPMQRPPELDRPTVHPMSDKPMISMEERFDAGGMDNDIPQINIRELAISRYRRNHEYALDLFYPIQMEHLAREMAKASKEVRDEAPRAEAKIAAIEEEISHIKEAHFQRIKRLKTFNEPEPLEGTVWGGAAERGIAIPKGIGEERDVLDRVRRVVVVPLHTTAEALLGNTGMEMGDMDAEMQLR